jgi:hypothetical protein
MATVEMAFVGYIKGMRCYAPIDAENDELLAGAEAVTCEVVLDEDLRTLKQNRSLHKYCTMLAKELNRKGLTFGDVLSDPMEIEFNGTLVKEHMWRATQFSMLNKKSTTNLKPNEVSKVYDMINLYLSTSKGVYVPFPNIQDLMTDRLMEQYNGEQ